jgi:hypothetical protein
MVNIGINSNQEIEIDTHKNVVWLDMRFSKGKRFISHSLFNKSFVHPSIYTFIYSIINFESMHKEHY